MAAIRPKPDYARARYNLGLVFLRLGNIQQALETYKTLRGLDTDLAERLFKQLYP